MMEVRRVLGVQVVMQEAGANPHSSFSNRFERQNVATQPKGINKPWCRAEHAAECMAGMLPVGAVG